jgi:hypothetical protein
LILEYLLLLLLFFLIINTLLSINTDHKSILNMVIQLLDKYIKFLLLTEFFLLPESTVKYCLFCFSSDQQQCLISTPLQQARSMNKIELSFNFNNNLNASNFLYFVWITRFVSIHSHWFFIMTTEYAGFMFLLHTIHIVYI